MLNEMQHFPDELYDADVKELVDILDGPTLFHLEGTEKKPLFISTLLHGNETTGFLAMQRILKKYRDTGLPRSISLFLGNIEAARANQRHLDSQDDYNRIWPGTRHADSPEKDMMQTVTNIMERRKPFASIDVHNNTGKNPHYACINILNPHGLELASKFSDIAVYFTSPKGVQSLAFSDFCPSLVLECGQSADLSGVDHAVRFIDSVLQMDALGSAGHGELKLYHTIARVTVPVTTSMADSEQESSSDILLNKELEDMNFRQPEVGTLFARKLSDKAGMLTVTSESNEDITDEYLDDSDGDYRIKRPVTLSMFTTNQRAIRQDCVCYFMEQLRIG
jgi:succinylglutamate desuccinylase